MWLAVKGRDQIPDFGLTVVHSYITEVVAIVEVAAEAYIFQLSKPRKRAQRLLKEADSSPLMKRFNARQAAYDKDFDEDQPVQISIPG
jgi:hypothetical protein